MNQIHWIDERPGVWNRKIMNFYWMVILISLLAELAALFITIHDRLFNLSDFFIHHMLIPFTFQLVIMGSSEFIIRRLKRESAYLIILTGTALSSVLIFVHETVDGIKYLLLLPMIISLFFDQQRKLCFALVANALILGVFYLVNPELLHMDYIYGLFVYMFVLLGAFFILYGLLERGKVISRHLRKSIQSEQDLLIRTVIMDRQTKLDALTDLYNHKTFHEYLDNLIAQSDKYGLPLQLAIIDIDNFKKVNDTFGHAVGDMILMRVSQVIKQSILSPDDITARFGGEEFAVIFTDKTLEQAFDAIERFRTQIEALSHHEMNGRNVTVSIGLASYRSGTNKATIFSEADSMLYAAKRGGKNQTITNSQQHPAV